VPRLHLLASVVACVSILTASCKSTYHIAYEFGMSVPPNSAGLTFADESFAFEFKPSPSGVAFEVRNLTKSDANLVWDRCYFVDPSGNTYKALNTDALEEASEMVMKSGYFAIIPAGAAIRRFTTASVNIQRYETVSLAVATSEYSLSSALAGGDANSAWSSVATLSAIDGSATTTTTSSFLVNRYWPRQFESASSEVPKRLVDVAHAVRNGSGMGLGLEIQHADAVASYRFQFEIERVLVTRVVQVPDPTGRTAVKNERRVEFTLAPGPNAEWIAPNPVAGSTAGAIQKR